MEKVAHELVDVSISSGQNLQPEFLAINPFGKLPAMHDESVLDTNGQPVTICNRRDPAASGGAHGRRSPHRAIAP